MDTVWHWITFAATSSIMLIYFKGGSSLVKDMHESVKSTGSYYGFVLVLFLSNLGFLSLVLQLLICLGFFHDQLLHYESWKTILGMCLTMLAVISLYLFRFRYLGNYWNGNVVIQPGQSVVERGPYRIVRHPIYATSFCMNLGISLAFPVWLNWAACMLMVVGYILLARYEDSFLARVLPGYTEYIGRVRYLMVPGIW